MRRYRFEGEEGSEHVKKSTDNVQMTSNTIQVHNKVKVSLDLRTCALLASLREGLQSAANATIRGKEWTSYQTHAFRTALDVLKGTH